MKKSTVKRLRIPAAVAGLALVAAPITTNAASASPPTATVTAAAADTAASNDVVNVCPAPTTLTAGCFAQMRTDVHGGFGVRGPAARTAANAAGTATAASTATTLPAGYGPADLQSAYNLPTTGGSGQTVAVVDAGDDPLAEADLAVYRTTYGLPPCTTANGCFTKADQGGQGSPLPADAGWAGEISLDLDMVSAACPGCRILLVEADADNLADLGASVNTAVTLGATVVSNSYGASESVAMQPLQADYTHPGVAIVAASGDGGYAIPVYPAVFPTVIAVGGTTLVHAPGTARGWSETAWSGTGSGCSAWITKPTWQTDAYCPGRMIADVSADADAHTVGIATYDSYSGAGWSLDGGTSAASPFIAGIIALAGNPSQYPDASRIYSHAADLNDVAGGSNSSLETSCGGDYLCTAVSGYDGPTGNGSPNGLNAF